MFTTLLLSVFCLRCGFDLGIVGWNNRTFATNTLFASLVLTFEWRDLNTRVEVWREYAWPLVWRMTAIPSTDSLLHVCTDIIIYSSPQPHQARRRLWSTIHCIACMGKALPMLGSISSHMQEGTTEYNPSTSLCALKCATDFRYYGGFIWIWQIDKTTLWAIHSHKFQDNPLKFARRTLEVSTKSDIWELPCEMVGKAFRIYSLEFWY